MTTIIRLTLQVMRGVAIAAALAGCGGGSKTVDAMPVDAMPDATELDCPAYCNAVQTHCTGANIQYTDAAHCMKACQSFLKGTVGDQSGNTLGCRLYHAGDPAKQDPATHCPHAGPGGDAIPAGTQGFCSGGDVCTSFCRLEVQACGSLEQPLPGDPRDGTNNPIFQYVNLDNCVARCVQFDKTHAYRLDAAGNSLACRLNAAVQAAVAVMPDGAMHCPDTALDGTGACAGPPTP